MSGAVEERGSALSWMINATAVFAWRMGTVVVGLGAVVATILYFKQDSLLYFPEVGGLPRRPGQNPRRYRNPSEHQIPYREEQILCEDGVQIHAWLLLRSEAKKNVPTLVFFHGNAGNIGLRLPNAIHMLQFLDANVLMVEYRGYGDSDTVTPNEAGLKLDAEAALRHIAKHPKIDPSQIFVFGRSLGGAVAFHLAQYAEQNSLPLAGVIVENTFLSISKMVDHLMPFVAPLKGLVLRIGWNSEAIVPHLQSPVLYLAGAMDQLVPHSHMLTLWKTTKLSKLLRLHVVPDGTHNETWMQGKQAYWDAINAFLKEAGHISSSSSSSSCANTEVPPVAAASLATGTSTVPGSPLDTMDASLVHRRSSQNGDTPKIKLNNNKHEESKMASTTTGTAASSSSIPIMPSGIMGMAREALRETSTTDINVDKKDM